MEPNEAMKAMARRCAAKYWQTGDPGDEATARSILSGEWDDQAYTQAALAAIMETQEACAKLAEECWRPAYVKFDDGEWSPGSPYDRGAVDNAGRIATAIRTGEHYALRHG